MPIVMSLDALGLDLGQIVLLGVARQADEGTAAHLWQLLMAAQMPIVAFFAIKYLSQKPRPGLQILSLQVLAVLAACVLVYMLRR